MLALLLFLQVQATPAVDTAGTLLTNAGVLRAAGKVDSVFVTRRLDSARVNAADWASYLMARLGVKPIPESGLRIVIDARALRLKGKLSDLPAEAQASLATFLAMLDPATPIEASVTMDYPQPDAIRFHLDSAWIADLNVPEPILGPGLKLVGDKYPVLMNGGRDLFVAIPANAKVRLTPGGVDLIGPPAAPPPPRRPAARKPR